LWDYGPVNAEGVVHIRQTTGGDYRGGTSFEVERPRWYRGPLDYDQFCIMAEAHYRSALSSIPKDVSGTFSSVGDMEVQPTEFEMEVDDTRSGGW
jgi:hypothetical protein